MNINQYMKDVFLGLGSNLGDRTKNLERAFELLEKNGVTVIKKSAVYETEPLGVKDQAWFFNCVVGVETALGPEELLNAVEKIEKEMGRQQTVKWGPRLIDIDILLYGDRIITSKGLTIPHKFLHERKFVLKPLSEVAGKRIHPVFDKSIQELLNECEDESIVRPL